jgi:hypothetical protein
MRISYFKCITFVSLFPKITLNFALKISLIVRFGIHLITNTPDQQIQTFRYTKLPGIIMADSITFIYFKFVHTSRDNSATIFAASVHYLYQTAAIEILTDNNSFYAF